MCPVSRCLMCCAPCPHALSLSPHAVVVTVPVTGAPWPGLLHGVRAHQVGGGQRGVVNGGGRRKQRVKTRKACLIPSAPLRSTRGGTSARSTSAPSGRRTERGGEWWWETQAEGKNPQSMPHPLRPSQEHTGRDFCTEYERTKWAADRERRWVEHTGRDFCTEYERTKWAADKVARRAVESEGLDVVLVYPCVIYGPGRISASNLVVKMIADHFQGRLPGLVGSGTRLNNFVHVNDVVLGLLAAHHRGTPGRRYILGGENASMVQLFQAVQRATGKPPPRLRLPLWLVAVLGLCPLLLLSLVFPQLGRQGPPTALFLPFMPAHSLQRASPLSDHPLSSFRPSPLPLSNHQSVRAFNHDRAYSSEQPDSPLHACNPSLPLVSPPPSPNRQSVRAFNHDWAYSSEQAQQDLEYSPLSLEEGLRDTLTWMRAVGAVTYMLS
ncbi:unnamed protein product [Closterium sp. Naga37s-1]|nr:unnamed protein product [Closterium sp. Naga37s-1]